MSLHIMEGVILVTGEHGTGKTRFAIESGDISKTLLVDDDLKGRSTVNRIKRDLSDLKVEIGEHIDFIERTSGKNWLQIYQAGMEIIDELEEGKFDVLVWDTWTNFESSIVAYVKANMDKFKPPNGWSNQGKIKNGETYKAARLYEAEIIAKIQSKVPLVILISHLKNHYKNNAATGKQIPAVNKAVDRVTNLRFWIRENPAYSTPIALVLKNTEKNEIGADGRLRPVKVFPTKITPLEGEKSLWDCMIRYFENPIGDRKPTAEETPNEFEKSIVDGTLTEDQKLSWAFAMKIKIKEDKELAELQQVEISQRAKELKEEGLPLPKIVLQINEEFASSYKVKDIAQMIKSSNVSENKKQVNV